MGFLVFTAIGLAIAMLHVVLPTEHRVGPVTAFFVGVFGAWSGALFLSAFHQGGWASFSLGSGAGAVIGAAASIAFLEVVAERWVHAEERSL
jgi:uncharacterized membrane protein YeaQ/YmgE (transglycosylase-associated protein family)